MTNSTVVIVGILAMLFCLSGVLILLHDSLLFYMEWYSGVEYDPPQSRIDRIMIYTRFAVVLTAVILVLFAYAIPSGVAMYQSMNSQST